MVERVRKAKLAANGTCFNNAPPIVTHGAPPVVMENLNSALRGSAGALSTAGRCAQPQTAFHRWGPRRCGWRRGRKVKGGRAGCIAESAIGAGPDLAASRHHLTIPTAFGSGRRGRRSWWPSAATVVVVALRDRESHEGQRQRQEKRSGHGAGRGAAPRRAGRPRPPDRHAMQTDETGVTRGKRTSKPYVPSRK